jgi:hypothetical protein
MHDAKFFHTQSYLLDPDSRTFGVGGQETEPTGPGGAEAQALMAELVALRAILLNVLFKLANREKLTAEEMQRLIDRADSDKVKKARERLAQAAESEGQPDAKS